MNIYTATVEELKNKFSEITRSSMCWYIQRYKDEEHILQKILSAKELLLQERENERKKLRASKVDRKKSPEGIIWSGIMGRRLASCKRNPYKDISVSENFQNFDFFVEWCRSQIGFGSKDDLGNTFEIDKDLLSSGAKVYSEDVCVFVPQEINAFYTNRFSKKVLPPGVFLHKNGSYIVQFVGDGTKPSYQGSYKTAEQAFEVFKRMKESRARELARKWEGKVDQRVVVALNNYNISIDGKISTSSFKSC